MAEHRIVVVGAGFWGKEWIKAVGPAPDLSVAAVAARTQASLADVFLALAAGAAGTLAFTSGVPAVVVGVMVAVALLPPLVTAGLLAGSGHWTLAAGAFMLVVTNVTCINLAATATFLIQKVRPRTWWEVERAKKATRRCFLDSVVPVRPRCPRTPGANSSATTNTAGVTTGCSISRAAVMPR